MKTLIDHLKPFFSGEYAANLFRKACEEYQALKFLVTEFGLPRQKSIKLTLPELMPQNITSLLVKKKAGAFFKFFYAPPFPIWIQLSGATTALVFLTILVLNYIIIGRQKEQLYQQTVRIGMVSLNYFADNAGIPLLEDNMIRLNTLIKEAGGVEGILYAFIVDNSQHVVAHSNFQRVGQAVPEFKDMEEIITREKVSYFNYTLPGGSHALNLIKPITFKDKKLGEVHVGVSIDFIEKLTREERSSIITITIGIIVLSVIIAMLMGYNFSRPIAKLVRATRQIGKGNYRYKVELSRNDELGNLATAFNQMGEDLWAKSLMQDSFGKYVGPEVLDMLLANPESIWLKGQRNHATVLFADVRQFTSYAEFKEPEEVVEALNGFFDIATRSIREYGGYIDKFIGDAILGVFGVPIQYDDHMEKALRASLDMQFKLHEASKKGNVLLKSVGIGINSGIVVSGNLGSQDKMEYTVIGDTVNLAARLSGLAGAGEIIISSNIREQLTDMITVQDLPPQKIKGKTTLIEVFKVLNMRGMEQCNK